MPAFAQRADHASEAARLTPEMVRVAVYDLAAMWRRDPDAALALADASARLFAAEASAIRKTEEK